VTAAPVICALSTGVPPRNGSRTPFSALRALTLHETPTPLLSPQDASYPALERSGTSSGHVVGAEPRYAAVINIDTALEFYDSSPAAAEVYVPTVGTCARRRRFGVVAIVAGFVTVPSDGPNDGVVEVIECSSS